MTIKGILILDPALTNSSNVTTDSDPDFTATVALPVPDAQKHPAVDKYIALPGAPLAYLSNFTNQYNDVSDMYRWMEVEGDFTESDVQEVRAYFSSVAASNMKSFICIPLLNNAAPFAVLNIHKNYQNMLADQDQRNQFVYVISPLIEILSQTLQKHLSKFPLTL